MLFGMLNYELFKMPDVFMVLPMSLAEDKRIWQQKWANPVIKRDNNCKNSAPNVILVSTIYMSQQARFPSV